MEEVNQQTRKEDVTDLLIEDTHDTVFTGAAEASVKGNLNTSQHFVFIKRASEGRAVRAHKNILSKLKVHRSSSVLSKSAHLRQFVVLLCCGSEVFRFKTTITVSSMGTLHSMTSVGITQSCYLTAPLDK